MAAITITATNLTEANIVRELSLSTESKTNAGGQSEQYRQVLRVVVERDVQDITNVTQVNGILAARSSIPNCRFNKSSGIEIFPLEQSGTTYPFQLVTQSFFPKEARGGKIFTQVQEYVSVTPFATLEWDVIAEAL